MRSGFQRLPAFVLQLVAKEAEREIACGPLVTDDLSIADIKTHVAANPTIYKNAVPGPKDLVYEVIRQQTDGDLIYLKSHMDRYGHSLDEVFGIGHASIDGASTVLSATKEAMEAVMRLQRTHYPIVVSDEAGTRAFVEQNIKYIAWAQRVDDDNRSCDAPRTPLMIDTLAFYIHSSYPPKEWYSTGATMGLLFGPVRTNPHVKVVYPELKAKAASNIAALKVFESLIVHEDGLVPEGVRSNYLLVESDGSVVTSLDDDILVGTTLLAVRSQCEHLGITITSKRLTVKDVVEAAAVAMLGTSVNVLPISTIVLGKDDINAPSMRGLLSSFTLGGYAEAPDAYAIRKDSGLNSTLQRLNAEYKHCTFH